MRRARNRQRLLDPNEQRKDLAGWLQKLGLTAITFRNKKDRDDRFVFMLGTKPITRGLTFREAKTFLQGLTNGLRLTNR